VPPRRSSCLVSEDDGRSGFSSAIEPHEQLVMTATDPTTPGTTGYADADGLQGHSALLDHPGATGCTGAGTARAGPWRTSLPLPAGFLTPRPQEAADGS
jgi:hypothetical protein